MGVRFDSCIGLIILVASTIYMPSVWAQNTPSYKPKTIPEVVDQVAIQSSGDFFENRSTAGDARFLFGIDYDDTKLAKDARRIEVLYQDLLKQQAESDPVIRTQDLDSPFNTSLRLSTQANP